MNAAAEIGVIGGSGVYALLEGAAGVEGSTPYGPPSDPITVAEVGVAGWRSCPGTGVIIGIRPTRSPIGRIFGRFALWGYARSWPRAPSAACVRSWDRALSWSRIS